MEIFKNCLNKQMIDYKNLRLKRMLCEPKLKFFFNLPNYSVQNDL